MKNTFMDSANSTPSDTATKPATVDNFIVGSLTVSTLLVIVYTFAHALIFQPLLQRQKMVANSVLPHETTLWYKGVRSSL